MFENKQCGIFNSTYMYVVHLQAGLVPSDDITIYYSTTPELGKIITDFSDFILTTIKQPLEAYPVPPGQNVIIEDTDKVEFEFLKHLASKKIY